MSGYIWLLATLAFACGIATLVLAIDYRAPLNDWATWVAYALGLGAISPLIILFLTR